MNIPEIDPEHVKVAFLRDRGTGAGCVRDVVVFNGQVYCPLKEGGRYKNTAVRGPDTLLSRQVWKEYRGAIPKGHHVHHVNENKGDDRLSNLALLSVSEHARLHGKKEKKIVETRLGLPFRIINCAHCGRARETNHPQTRFCTKSCKSMFYFKK